jgi:NaMN:DMB phosphoribosyltransferase
MPVSLGIAESVRNSDLILAGGTQMATCSYLIQTMKQRIPYLCTTSWVMKDSGENIKKLVPRKYLVTSEIKMDGSRHEGLRMYERGHVKEGAGMGAAFMLASSLNGDEARIYGAVDKLYEDLS